MRHAPHCEKVPFYVCFWSQMYTVPYLSVPPPASPAFCGYFEKYHEVPQTHTCIPKKPFTFLIDHIQLNHLRILYKHLFQRCCCLLIFKINERKIMTTRYFFKCANVFEAKFCFLIIISVVFPEI